MKARNFGAALCIRSRSSSNRGKLYLAESISPQILQSNCLLNAQALFHHGATRL